MILCTFLYINHCCHAVFCNADIINLLRRWNGSEIWVPSICSRFLLISKNNGVAVTFCGCFILGSTSVWLRLWLLSLFIYVQFVSILTIIGTLICALSQWSYKQPAVKISFLTITIDRWQSVGLQTESLSIWWLRSGFPLAFCNYSSSKPQKELTFFPWKNGRRFSSITAPNFIKIGYRQLLLITWCTPIELWIEKSIKRI